MNLNYFASIDYDEPDQTTYRGIILSNRKEGFEKTFSNDIKCPIIDIVQLREFLSDVGDGCRWSSSYDHFYMDGEMYVERYVKCAGDDPDDWCFVLDRNLILTDQYDFSIMSKPEFETFQELRKYIKGWKYENNK